MATFTNDLEYPSESIFCAASTQLSTVGGCRSSHSTIDTLSDDVLLFIFNSYRRAFVHSVRYDGRGIWPWHTFVHVCRRWRCIVFTFPGYLSLRLLCYSKSDVQAALNIWPALPLSLDVYLGLEDGGEEDVLSALEYRDRIAGIHFSGFRRPQLENCAVLMQNPFPALKSLELKADEETMFVITDTFLGGSAPLLQEIFLGKVRFPGLPKLLSSTSDLVNLNLWWFPMTGEGQLPPNEMTTCLSVLTRLQSFTVTFPMQTSRSSPYPTDQCPPSSAHTILPALTYLSLKGPRGYLEDLVGQIDAPQLNSGHLVIYDEPRFDTPRIPWFIHRTKISKLLGGVEVDFRRERPGRRAAIRASFRSIIGLEIFCLYFPCSGFPAQVAVMERICTQCTPLFSHVEFLKIFDDSSEEKKWWEAITQWQGILRPFTAVKTLRLRGIAIVPHVAYILGGRLEAERVTEVLPALRTIELDCPLEGQNASGIVRFLEPFIAMRKESGHPVVVNVNSRSY